MTDQTNRIQRNGYIFNTIGGMLNAFQSVFILMVITRKLTMDDAGLFTIAYSVANLMLNIGKFGMRNYQVTDVSEKYGFLSYLRSRITTTFAMVIISIIYVAVKMCAESYPMEKVLLIFMMCVLKAVDSVEDIYHGKYQQVGRLDIAGKCLTLHMIAVIITFTGSLILGTSLLIATFATIVVSVLATWATIVLSNKSITTKSGVEAKEKTDNNQLGLINECLPLFFAAFVSFYQINAPKYAIDSLMTEADQANFGFISMPVFFSSLICQFIYLPALTGMAEKYSLRKIKEFLRLFGRFSLLINGASIIIIVSAYLSGLPILSLIYYPAKLEGYKWEFLLLMVGSGFLAYINFLISVLTIFRKQKLIIWGYAMTACFEMLITRPLVEKRGLLGASAVFSSVMLLLMLYLCIAVFVIARQSKRKN